MDTENSCSHITSLVTAATSLRTVALLTRNLKANVPKTQNNFQESEKKKNKFFFFNSGS